MFGKDIIEIAWFPQGYATRVIRQYENEIHEGSTEEGA
jgi:hypothetical protein